VRSLAAVAGAFVLALAACGGGGGGGGGTPPTAPMPRFSFTPAGAAGAGSLALTTGSGSTSSQLRLDLVATEAVDLYGVSFDLVFPTQTVRFDAASEGVFLSAAGGVATSFQVFESEPGRLVVGLSRLGGVAGIAGSGTLLTLQFGPVAAGSGALAFEDARAFDSDGDEISAARFVGGTVTYTP